MVHLIQHVSIQVDLILLVKSACENQFSISIQHVTFKK